MTLKDTDKILEEIKGYDLNENSPEYKAFVREITLAPVEARSLGDWLRMKLNAREHAIDFRFKDMPMTKERWMSFQCWIVGLIIAYFFLSVVGALKLYDVWKH